MNKVILVTGANRGIGEAIVKELAVSNPKDTILLGCRDLKMGSAIASDFTNIKAVHLDLGSMSILDKGLRKILIDYPHIDILVNNAGILYQDSAMSISDEKFNEVLQVNLLAAYKLIKVLAPSMIKNSFGKIINISSGWGQFEDGLTGPFSYSLTKASLNALTLTLSQELPECIEINSMCPGWVHTRMGGKQAPRTPEQGAATAIWLINRKETSSTGCFYRDEQKINW